jgi:hypothetical protein
VTKVSAVIPDALAAELERRARAGDRTLSAEIRRGFAAWVQADGAIALGNGWRLEEDWSGLWAVRDKPGRPGAVVERPLASVEVE